MLKALTNWDFDEGYKKSLLSLFLPLAAFMNVFNLGVRSSNNNWLNINLIEVGILQSQCSREEMNHLLNLSRHFSPGAS